MCINYFKLKTFCVYNSTRGGPRCLPYVPNFYNPRFTVSQVIIINKIIIKFV
jgi:hypothetical protein